LSSSLKAVRVQCPWSRRWITIDEKGWKHVIKGHSILDITDIEEDLRRAIERPRLVTDDGFQPTRQEARYASTRKLHSDSAILRC
jgi:hypothetical protein